MCSSDLLDFAAKLTLQSVRFFGGRSGFGVLQQTPRSIAVNPSEQKKPLGTLMREALTGQVASVGAKLVAHMLHLPGSDSGS